MKEEERTMKLITNDGQTIEIQTIEASGSDLTITMLRTDGEAIKRIFGDEMVTKRMTAEGKVYEGYTILDRIVEHVGKIWEFVLLKSGSPEDDKTKDAAVKLAKILAKSVDDQSAIDVKYLFDAWSGAGVAYAAGDRVLYNDLLYKVIQAHTSQADWTPDTAVSLFVRVDDPGEAWPEWRQPAGAHDAYEKGAHVSHNEKHWESTADANVWEPGVYGWEEM